MIAHLAFFLYLFLNVHLKNNTEFRTSNPQNYQVIYLWRLHFSYIVAYISLYFPYPAGGVAEIRDGEDLWQWSRLEIKLNPFRWSTTPQKQFIIIINIIIVIIKKTECCYIMEPLVYIYMCRQIDRKIFRFELVYPLILSVPEKWKTRFLKFQ